ncbi:DUF5663 domain-containing protein [Dietzia sp. SL131]|uniref:DUF5663 domain-containing protein n=1 Tax=Dietzia sp. SL131 TaxID=2995149 RepID=UPI00227AA170|nr:DUF5663 domain-containing protein [Dietzia sp. SL131]MCY1658242.1 DUF5663 domain-containing protein [Dietzia sp. SL131]
MTLDIIDELRRRLPGVAVNDIATLAEQVHSELESRVGKRLADGLTDEQFREFDETLESGDEEAASRWLQVNRPDYLETTRSITNELLDEVSERIISTDPSAACDPAQTVSTDTLSKPPVGRSEGERLRDWQQVRGFLESRFECHLASDRAATFFFPTSSGRSQVLTVRSCTADWAEVYTTVGKGLDQSALATALHTLSDFVGVGAVTHDDLLIARHGLAYAGLTIESTLKTIAAVAHAADRAEEAATGEELY